MRRGLWHGAVRRTQRRVQSSLQQPPAHDVILPWFMRERPRILWKGHDLATLHNPLHEVRFGDQVLAELTREAAEHRQALYERQLELEASQLEKAAEEYENMRASLTQLGLASSLKPVHPMLLSWYAPLARVLAKRRAEAHEGELGPMGSLLLLLPPDELAVLTMHTVAGECLKSPAGVRLAQIVTELGAGVQVEARLKALGDAHSRRPKDGPRGVDPKRLVRGTSRRVVNVRAQRALERLESDTLDWESSTKAQVGSLLFESLRQVARIDDRAVFDVELRKTRGKTVNHVTVLKEFVDEATDDALGVPRYLPMLVEPKPWRGLKDGGFFKLGVRTMRTHGCLVQAEAVTRAKMPKVYAALDALGRVPWAVNKQVFEVVKRSWADKVTLPDLPSQIDAELPEKPEDDDDALRQWRRRCSKLKQRNAEMHSLRSDLEIKLSIADQFANEEAFYFPYNVDFRGRAYPIPPNLNNLGSDVCRGVLKFARAKELGPRGLFWLRVHLANLCGMSKSSLDERAKFAEDKEPTILSVADDPINNPWWHRVPEEPWQALATCKEIAHALRYPEGPEKYPCSMPVHADGSCNGLQHYASLGRDLDGGRAVNLLPGDRPSDVYADVCAIVVKRVAADARAPDEVDEAAQLRRKCAQICDGLINRKVVKQTVMTSVYGVTYVGAREQILKRLQERLDDVLEEEDSDDKRRRVAALVEHGALDSETHEIVDPVVYRCSLYLAKVTLEALAELFTSARLIMTWLGACARLVSKDGQPVSWITPLGLPVVQPYRRDRNHMVQTTSHRIMLADHVDSLPVNTAKQKSAFAPNFVHSLDSTHMFMTALEMDRLGLDFTAVHDSYWTHPANMDTMNAVLRECFVKLYSEPILENLLDSLQQRHPHIEFPPLPPRGTLDLDEVKRATYFFS